MSTKRVRRILAVGLLTGFLLNLTGWLGNNLLLRDLWQEVGHAMSSTAWRDTPWRDVFSVLPDFVYGFAICWLYVRLRPGCASGFSASIQAGSCVAIVGGITTYFALANSGFIPWQLALASFVLVLASKLVLAILAGHLIGTERPSI